MTIYFTFSLGPVLSVVRNSDDDDDEDYHDDDDDDDSEDDVVQKQQKRSERIQSKGQLDGKNEEPKEIQTGSRSSNTVPLVSLYERPSAMQKIRGITHGTIEQPKSNPVAPVKRGMPPGFSSIGESRLCVVSLDIRGIATLPAFPVIPLTTDVQTIEITLVQFRRIVLRACIICWMKY